MKAKRYKIETMQDIVDCTNEGNLDNFLIDFKEMLKVAHNLRSISESIGEMTGAKIQKANVLTFNWIDDGKHKGKIIIKGNAK
jgi:hypothetical protein